MEQTLIRNRALSHDSNQRQYVIQPHQNHVIRAKDQVLEVRSGLAWVSNKGEDFVVKSGDSITLSRGGDAVVTVSGLFGKALHYSLK